MPRTAGDIVADLHALLTAAAIPGPYVLAGHSFGGLVARLYAATYPDEVVGLVLVDAAHEDYYAAMREALTPEQRAEIVRLEEQGPPELADYPDRERLDTDASADPDAGGGGHLPLAPAATGRPHSRPPLGLAVGLPRRRPGGSVAPAAGGVGRVGPGWPSRRRRAERALHPRRPTGSGH